MAWSLPSNYKSRPIAVLGAGQLGRRIAACFIAAGWHVLIRDPSSSARNDALSYIKENISTYLGLTHAGKPGKYEAIEDIGATVKEAWLVIEAVPEVLEMKEDTFAELERLAPKDCVLATNSSSFKSRELLGKVKEQETKERVLNTHFMMPPQAMIVELMTSGSTNSAIFSVLEKEFTAAGLHPVTAQKESTGFIFNRIWAAIKREVLAVIAEGVASPETIDNIWKEQYQSPVGPCTLMDSVGLDTVEHIESHYVQDRKLPDTTLKWLHENYIEPGKLGNKSDKGGLYPRPQQGHGTKILALNWYQGAFPGELPRDKLLSSGQVLEIPVDNAAARPTAIVTDQKMPDGIDVHDGRMYWTCMGMPSDNDGAVYSAKLDGTDIKTVMAAGDKVHTPKQIHVDRETNKLYFCDREGLRIHRCNLDGSEHEIIYQTGDWRTEPEKVADQTQWPVGITISHKLSRVFWTQKGGSKAGLGRVLCAGIASPSNPSARNDVEVILDGLPEPIDLEFDDDAGILYWTDRGEVPFGNTLNKKTLIGSKDSNSLISDSEVPAAEKELGRQIIAQGFGEAIGLRLDRKKKHIYVADLTGRLWRCGTEPGVKERIYEAAGHAYTGLAVVDC